MKPIPPRIKPPILTFNLLPEFPVCNGGTDVVTEELDDGTESVGTDWEGSDEPGVEFAGVEVDGDVSAPDVVVLVVEI